MSSTPGLNTLQPYGQTQDYPHGKPIHTQHGRLETERTSSGSGKRDGTAHKSQPKSAPDIQEDEFFGEDSDGAEAAQDDGEESDEDMVSD